MPKFWTISKKDWVKMTHSKWPSWKKHVQYNLFKIIASQVEHLSILGYFLLVFEFKKTMNSCNVNCFLWHKILGIPIQIAIEL
jgi:hypothetical protein